MWARAVWVEGNQIIEDVVPASWIDRKRKLVWWPSENEATSLKKMKAPDDSWFRFKLVKVKIEAGNILFPNFFQILGLTI